MTGRPAHPSLLGHPAATPYGPARNIPRDITIHTGQPLHEQFGPTEPAYASFRDWFIHNTQEPLDEIQGMPRVGLLNAYTYRYLHPDITSYDLLMFHARGDPELAACFGIDPNDPPDHSTISRAYYNRLDAESRGHLQLRIAKRAIEATKAGIRVNEDASLLVAHHLPEDRCHYHKLDPIIEEDTVDVAQKKKAQAGEQVMEFIDALDLGRPEKGTTYSDADVLSVWKNAGVETTFAESAAEDTDEHETARGVAVPVGETVRSAVRDLEVRDDELSDGLRAQGHEQAVERRRAEKWADGLDAINEDLIREAQSRGMFDRKVTICIDGTAIATRPKNNPTPGDGGTKNIGKEESKWCYKHITISAVDCRRSLKLGSVMLYDLGRKFTKLIELLERVRELVKVGWVTWDSGFESGKLRVWCDQNNIRYIGRRSCTDNVVELMENNPVNEEGTAGLKREFRYTDGTFAHLFGVHRGEIGVENPEKGKYRDATLEEFTEDGERDDYEWVMFITNSDSISEVNVNAHAMIYRVRWSIETAYRVIKDEFKAKTTSRRPSMRVFVWHLAMVLYNAWVLLRILLRKDDDFVTSHDSAIRARSFAKIVLSDYG